MIKHIELTSIIVLALFFARPYAIPAFPGAVGYGASAVGGRGGKVLFVDNLDDSGPGSLRAALEAEGPRIVLFRVSGYITVQSTISILHPFLTIAGQTAPGDGICIKRNRSMKDGAVSISTHDIVIRYLRIRSGPGRDGECCGDCLRIGAGAENIVIDHCSLSWGTDEITSSKDVKNVTYQNVIVAEGLDSATHAQGAHSMGLFICGVEAITVYRCLIAHCSYRSPVFRSLHGTHQFINNIVYNWGSYGLVCRGEDPGDLVIKGNYFKAGQNSNSNHHEIWVNQHRVRLFVKDNIGPNRPDSTYDERSCVGTGQLNKPHGDYFLSLEPQNPSVPLLGAPEAFESVLKDVGTRLPLRDAADVRIVNDVRNGTGTIIDWPEEVGGYPELNSGTLPVDSDNDGMSDAWEQKNGLDPRDPSDNNTDTDGDGYTNIEEYINAIAAGSNGTTAVSPRGRRTAALYQDPAQVFTLNGTLVGTLCGMGRLKTGTGTSVLANSPVLIARFPHGAVKRISIPGAQR
jgi:pectate lyase